ncbi:efflux RND transporter periplasmic adaptor subunit [Ramlibacter sp. MMS24-I3-19]|uniref:efflux RND transporter periplasmic adaptor subunit n=1 Tax=Ramlibacter sp. MMS24-I3-19 TaxID=3416606 RepID=UPI003D04E0E2
MQLRRKHVAWGAAAAVAVALLAWAFSPRPVQVETAVAAVSHFEQGIEEDSQTRLKDRYTVSAPVAARLVRIALKEGDRVAAGDVVAVLLPTMSAMIDERSAREAQARYQAARANVTAAVARVDRAAVSLDKARLELERTEKLARQGFVAPSRLDEARLGATGATRELDAARAAQDAAEHDRDQAAAALQPVSGSVRAGKPLALRSPVEGVVLRIPLASEATVAAGAPIMDIGDPRRLEVMAELLTTDAVQAQPGRRAVVERWGGPPVEGVVRRVEPGAFTKVSALGIEEQRVKVLVDLVDPPVGWEVMGDGYRVTLRVITQSVDQALVVPVGALFPIADGGMAVYRLESGRAKLQLVDVGGRNGSEAWIRSGLKHGQVVIVYPPPAVQDGKRVAVRRPER